MSDNGNNAFESAIVIALGSNLPGHYRSIRALLEAATAALPTIGLPVARVSRWWRSAAWPDVTDPDYLNGVVLVETGRSPRKVLAALRDLETAFGRRRVAPNGPRTLDLDLIAHGRTKLADDDLTLPHPRAHLRRFVMGPLAEIAPGWIHPVLGAAAGDLVGKAVIGLDATPLGGP